MRMKMKIFTLVLLVVSINGFSNIATAQSIVVDAPTLDEVISQMEHEAFSTGKYLTGVMVEHGFDFFEEASSEVMSDGLTVYELEIEAYEAMGLCVYFDDFHIPVGGELFFESPDGAFDVLYSEGPIDASENNAHGRWVSGDIPGSVIKIIYRQPVNAVGSARLGIMGVGFFARNVERGSDDCEVDVMCPEGDSWQCERDAVVKLRITQSGGIYLCSGAMVNNTERDCRQLLLSAFHCADAVEENEWAFFKVQYNYEYLECGGTVSINSHTRTGVLPLSNSDDATNQGFSGSDFLLVEVEDPIPDTWNPFYAGFDASGETGHSGVGIHHPSGDRKKISTYTNPLTSFSAGSAGSHWRVYWEATETNHGVTEGGSSGSPIFSENHQIVGTLSSGLSACTVGGVGNGTGPNQPDFYGKMSYHWDGANPIPSSQHLDNFLDPSGSGQEIIYGSYVGEGDQPCGNFGACSATEIQGMILEEKGWSFSPNPAFDRIQIQMPAGATLSELRIYDTLGRLEESIILSVSQQTMMVNVMQLSTGLHYLTVRTPDGTSSTMKLIVE